MLKHFLIEGTLVNESEIPESEIKNIKDYFIKKRYFIEDKQGNLKVNVCGIANYKKCNYIFFPKKYSKDENRNEKMAKLIFQAIRKYKGEILFSDDEKEWFGNENHDLNHLDNMLWLIEDYLENGIINISQRITEKNGRGRIEWSRTIKSKIPFIINSNFIYLDLLTTKNDYNINHIISKIHEKIVLECINDIGWLLNVSNTTKKTIDLKISEKEQIILLEKKLKEIFVSREIRLIKSLISYLKESTNNNSDFALVTNKFENIWEEMLKFIFNHDRSVKIPQPYWELEGENSVVDNKRQIPDIIVKLDKTSLVVIDAKYYSIKKGIPSSFPGWQDIVKQLFYSLSLKGKYKVKYNLFLMPGDLINRKFDYLGYTSVDGKEKEFGYVYAFSVDIKTVLDSYILNKTNKELFDQIICNLNQKY